MSNPMEEMSLPCPMDICDGSGVHEDGRACPHTDTEDYDPELHADLREI